MGVIRELAQGNWGVCSLAVPLTLHLDQGTLNNRKKCLFVFWKQRDVSGGQGIGLTKSQHLNIYFHLDLGKNFHPLEKQWIYSDHGDNILLAIFFSLQAGFMCCGYLTMTHSTTRLKIILYLLIKSPWPTCNLWLSKQPGPSIAWWLCNLQNYKVVETLP